MEPTLLKILLVELWAKGPDIPPSQHLASVIALVLCLRLPLQIYLKRKHLSWLTILSPREIEVDAGQPAGPQAIVGESKMVQASAGTVQD